MAPHLTCLMHPQVWAGGRANVRSSSLHCHSETAVGDTVLLLPRFVSPPTTKLGKQKLYVRLPTDSPSFWVRPSTHTGLLWLTIVCIRGEVLNDPQLWSTVSLDHHPSLFLAGEPTITQKVTWQVQVRFAFSYNLDLTVPKMEMRFSKFH